MDNFPLTPLLLITKSHPEVVNSVYTMVGIAPPFEMSPDEPFPYHDHRIIQVKALWDTGASISCISDRLVQQLDLHLLDHEKVVTASGVENMPLLMGHLVFPNQTHFLGWEILQFRYGDDDCDLIIGMDVINQGDFSITNFGGRTLFSFRIPSLHSIDYEGEWLNRHE